MDKPIAFTDLRDYERRKQSLDHRSKGYREYIKNKEFLDRFEKKEENAYWDLGSGLHQIKLNVLNQLENINKLPVSDSIKDKAIEEILQVFKKDVEEEIHRPRIAWKNVHKDGKTVRVDF